MKKILFLTLLSIALYVNKIQAQFPCGNYTTTNPNAPVNNQQYEPYFQNDHFLNTFDWYAHTQNTIDGWQYENMGDFFGQQSGVFPSPFSIQGVSPDYDYLLDGGTEADYFYEDGWELLFMNMGQYPDGTILNASEMTLSTIPYVILYNKYKSTIRVFGKTTTDITNSTFKAVEVKIAFRNSKVSGLFSILDNKMSALDKETKITKVVALCNHPNSFQQWFHADFQVAYDPCVCYFRSDLQLFFTFIQSSDITLAGRSISIEQDLYDNTTNSLNYDKEFLTNIFKNDNSEAEAGSIIYKDIDNMLDDYIAKLEAVEQYNSDPTIKRNKTILKLIKGLKNGVVSYLSTDLLFNATLQLTPYVVKAVHYVTQQPFSLEIDPEKLKKELKKVVGKGYDQFTSSLEKKLVPNPPSTPEMPTAIVSEMSFSGHINTTIPTGISMIFNPGTFNNNNVYNTGEFSSNEQISVYNYPAYNEALGTFAMLKSPKLEKFNNVTEDPYEFITDQYNEVISISQHRGYNLTYKLNEPLKYLFNPILDLNYPGTKISASYEIIAESVGAFTNGYTVAYPPSIANSLTPYIQATTHDFNILNLSLDQSSPNTIPNDISSNSVRYSSPFVPLECFSEMVVGFTNDYTISFIPNLAGGIEQYISMYEDLTYNVYVKLLIEYSFNSNDHNGSQNKTTQILTYKVDEFSTTTYPNINYNLIAYPENIGLTTINIPNDSTYHAWNSVNILGDITQNTGVIANIWAGNQINVKALSRITPSTGGSINLSINPVLTCNTDMPPMDAVYVNNFCQSNNYKAKDIDPGYRSKPFSGSNSDVNEIDLTVSRDASKFTLSSSNSNDQQIVFTVTTMSGQILLTKNQVPQFVDMSVFATGIYLFTLSTEKGSVTKKIVSFN